MADDVIKIEGPADGAKLLAEARLRNFRTGEHDPRAAHLDWINRTLKAALAASPTPWADILAYASKKGTNTSYDNQALSERRRASIHDAVIAAIPRTGLIKQNAAFGSSRSGGD